ncbi:MAG: ATP-binding protein [Ekhidna sp.]
MNDPESNKRKLYPDFTLTEDNCDIEPIHRPVAIQGHGHILCFDHNSPNHVLACSEGLNELFQVSADTIWTKQVNEWMPEHLMQYHVEMNESKIWDSVDPIPLELNNTRYNIIRHIHNQRRFIEFEPSFDDHAELSTFRAIRIVTHPLYRINELEELYNELAQQYRKVSNYDRVMVYKFDHDNHGHVIGEAKNDQLESFLGLHYPATDIPKMARDLFLLNKSRIIPDVNQENAWLQFNPGIQNTIPMLDLSYSQLRATSPIHIQYLKNMGVKASFTLSIIIENKLWGLIACHNYEASKFVSYEMRKTGELIANALAQRISEVEKHNFDEGLAIKRNCDSDFLSKIGIDSEIGLQLMEISGEIQNLCDADGCAVIVQDLGIKSNGLVPDEKQLVEIKDWLVNRQAYEPFSTDDLANELPQLKIAEKIGGMVSISFDNDHSSFILWFKKSQAYKFHWGGDPNQPYEVDYLNDGEIRLSPRKSFEKWEQRVGQRSEPWSQIELDIVERVHLGLQKKLVERNLHQSRAMKDDFEQLTYVASHDLQEPLRTVSNYVQLLSEEISEDEKVKVGGYIQKTIMAASRMRHLINDILDYSRLNQETESTWISLQDLLDELITDMEVTIKESSASIVYHELPVIKADKIEVRQLFQNLISNALKYKKSTDLPRIVIEALHSDDCMIISVKDNGIGIEKKYFDRIFQLFQRLHTDEYEGTGIGLAQCKKIVEKLHGKIWVTSESGQGSTFSFSIHESITKANER